MACEVAALQTNVCLWCGEADLSLPYLVGPHSPQLPLRESGRDATTHLAKHTCIPHVYQRAIICEAMRLVNISVGVYLYTCG